MRRVWAGRDGWVTLARVIDCHTRELLGWHLSRSGRASTASSALEHARIARFGTLGRVPKPFLLRSDNGLVFTSRVVSEFPCSRRVEIHTDGRTNRSS
ncbi:DDE-type integrase/transposase/recombinase [Burkholderia pseudomallei]|uniref:DDE-type integrase/transposase/recombinase n=1 Tax=Burkholderia pseudomallei TaxID=28450 RepID=UPI001EEE3BE8|nr:DDE-type integrase/transposase/recombinase [Burkholderia pseudomallei]